MQILKKHKFDGKTRRETIARIAAFLKGEKAVSFAYIYGSFIEDSGFNDIDLAVFVDEAIVNHEKMLDCQLDLSVNLEREFMSYPVDVRALNIAPLSFRFSVITKGELAFSRNERERVSFEVMTRSLYFDFKPHAEFFYQKIALGA